jgi:hypothetical protein
MILNAVRQPNRRRIGLQRGTASAETVPLLCHSASRIPHKTAQFALHSKELSL